MALDVDGFAILQAITAQPDVFSDIRAEAAKAGRALVVRRLKVRGLTLTDMRRVRESLGPEPFVLVLDSLTDAEARSLVTRLDRHHPDLRGAGPDWARGHLLALAKGAEPAPRASTPSSARPAAEPAPPKPPGVRRALGSAAFAASWDGKDHDPKPKKSKKKRD